MLDISSDTATASATAAVCENIATFGAAPERGELDSREVWDEDDAIEALGEAIRVIVDGITVDGTQMADEREALMWGFVNMLHSQVQRLDRAVDRIVPEMRDLEPAQDGTEVKAWELQLLTDRAQNLGDRRDAFEKMRDLAADAYRAETGDVWRPRHGSHTSHTGQLTSAAIDARDFRRARRTARPARICPTAPSSPSPAARPSPIPTPSGARSTAPARSTATWSCCTAAAPASRRSQPAGPMRAASTRSSAGPDWNAHGKAAPFRRNDELLNFLPKGVIAFPGSGITGNLVDKARQLGIPVMTVAA